MEVITAFSKQQLFQQQAIAPPVLPPPLESAPKEQPSPVATPNLYTQIQQPQLPMVLEPEPVVQAQKESPLISIEIASL